MLYLLSFWVLSPKRILYGSPKTKKCYIIILLWQYNNVRDNFCDPYYYIIKCQVDMLDVVYYKSILVGTFRKPESYRV